MAGAEIARPPVHLITLAQLALLIPISLGLLAVDEVVAYSVVSGGLVAIVPQAYFAVLAFRWRGAQSASAIARSSYAGVLGKFLLSIAGFALVFAVVRPIDGPAVFMGYLAMLVTQITGSWMLLTRSHPK
jgi:ATP synthase protein I